MSMESTHCTHTARGRGGLSKLTPPPSAQITAQHRPAAPHLPKNTSCSSQHCSLSCAAAPGELSVRNCKIPLARTGPRHTASHPARAPNSQCLTAPAAPGEAQQRAGPHLSLQNTIKHPANCVVNKNHKPFGWKLQNIQQSCASLDTCS